MLFAKYVMWHAICFFFSRHCSLMLFHKVFSFSVWLEKVRHPDSHFTMKPESRQSASRKEERHNCNCWLCTKIPLMSVCIGCWPITSPMICPRSHAGRRAGISNPLTTRLLPWHWQLITHGGKWGEVAGRVSGGGKGLFAFLFFS